ncbi:MAG: hypothetical protein SFX72_04335 [Isosphaeraceae bacterium]|nr:hypothetical protein [Isosphaeraceae bacterium]
MSPLIFLLSLMFTPAGDPVRPADRTPRKLIEFGWDEPDTSLLLAWAKQIEAAPFDGCVFHVDARDADGKPNGSLTWKFWSERAFTQLELAAARKDLEAIAERGSKTARPMSHFLRINITPGTVDWFGDHAPIIENARRAAALARAGRFAGILLDTEPYETPLFDFSKQPNAATRSFEEHAERAREVGRAIMSAFQDEFPDLHVLLTFGHSYPWTQMQRARPPKQLAQVADGLLAPFLDGMIAASRGRSKIIDGYELSYGYRERARFTSARELITRGLDSITSDPAKYRERVSVGFGLWLDYDWRRLGWNVTDLERNHFTPDGFAASLRAALDETDEYVWIYTEQPRWWTAGGKVEKLPRAYIDRIREIAAGR